MSEKNLPLHHTYDSIVRLPDAELEVMQAIWNNPVPISTANIKEYLDRKRSWNISALQTLLNRLIERGFLCSEKQGKHRYYQPIIEEERYLAYENRSFLRKLNGSSVKKLVASLYDSQSISDEDLQELADFIAEKTRGNSDGGGNAHD